MMDRKFYRLYPNIYVLIVAESARIRKSVGMEIGLGILKSAIPDIFYITGRATPEGIVKHMNQKKGGNSVSKIPTIDSHVFLYADELATLFGYEKQTASRLAILLTEIYGCPDHYEHTTKGEGVVDLFNLYPTLLAATDPRNLKVLPEEAVGGLIGRTIFVTAGKKRKSIAWPDELLGSDQELREKLVHDLREINSLEGNFRADPEARRLFADWYEAQDQLPSTGNPQLDAFQARYHDTAIKIAMLVSLARGNELVVRKSHMMAGINIIESQLPEFSRVMNWTSTSIHSQNRAKFLDILQRYQGVATRPIMLRAMGLTVDEFGVLENTLIQEGSITTRKIGRDLIYKITTEGRGTPTGEEPKT